MTRNRRWMLGLALQFCLSALVWSQTRGGSSASKSIVTFDAPGAGASAGQGTTPQSINDAGEITGYFKDSTSVLHGFVRHKNGAFTTFEAPGASKKATLGTFPQSINDQGGVVGYYFTDPNGVRHGFVRSADGTILRFDPGNSKGTVVRQNNSAGEFTGNYVSYDMVHGFLAQKDRRFVTFDPPGSANTAPEGINSSGEITGYYADDNNALHGFVRRADGTFSTFNVPGASATEGKGTVPMGINSKGDVVGYYHFGPKDGTFAFLRTKDGSILKFDPPGSITDNAPHVDDEGYIVRPVAAALSINEAGDIAGYFGDSAGVVHGFVRRRDGSYSTFDAPGAARNGNLGTFSDSINNSGDVTGHYFAANAVLHGFLLPHAVSPAGVPGNAPAKKP